MNIQFDLNHPVDVNFFKNSIIELNKRGHKIIITYRPRGKLDRILKHELGEYICISFGKHYSNFITKIIGQIYRDYKIFFFQKKNNIDLSVCFGPTNAIASWINRIPYLAFEDDFEYKIPFYHANIFSTRHVMPSSIKVKRKNIYTYEGFKELAYLHPNYFIPCRDEIKRYKLKQNKYVFIREVSKVSLNYKNKETYILQILEHLKKRGLQLLLSIEDEDLKKNLLADCIILEEPVHDIYSLMKYALFTISSGDTMARESCLLGTAAIYTGGREMAVNKELLNIGIMFKSDCIGDILNICDKLIDGKCKNKIRHIIEKRVTNDWDDTTQVILKHVGDFVG